MPADTQFRLGFDDSAELMNTAQFLRQYTKEHIGEVQVMGSTAAFPGPVHMFPGGPHPAHPPTADNQVPVQGLMAVLIGHNPHRANAWLAYCLDDLVAHHLKAREITNWTRANQVDPAGKVRIITPKFVVDIEDHRFTPAATARVVAIMGQWLVDEMAAHSAPELHYAPPKAYVQLEGYMLTFYGWLIGNFGK